MVGILCIASVCLDVVSHGLPPTASWYRDNCPSNVGHLFSHLVDLTVLRICILSDIDKDICFPQWRFSVISTPRYLALVTVSRVVQPVAGGDLISFLVDG